jgi:hypothetical protein
MCTRGAFLRARYKKACKITTNNWNTQDFSQKNDESRLKNTNYRVFNKENGCFL